MVKLLPPLTITCDELKRGLDILEQAVAVARATSESGVHAPLQAAAAGAQAKNNGHGTGARYRGMNGTLHGKANGTLHGKANGTSRVRSPRRRCRDRQDLKKDVLGTEREVKAKTWTSHRLLLADDGMGFSMHDTVIHAGTETHMWYRNHLEAVYCVAGRGTIEVLSTGEVFPIEDGTIYALDKHDEHILRAEIGSAHGVRIQPAAGGPRSARRDRRLSAARAARRAGQWQWQSKRGQVRDMNSTPTRTTQRAPRGGVPVGATAAAAVRTASEQSSDGRASQASAGAPDPYYSRIGATWELCDRREPVVWSEGPGRGPLTAEQLASYEQNGFLVMPALFSQDEVASLLAECERMAAAADPSRDDVIIEPTGGAVRSLFRIHQTTRSWPGWWPSRAWPTPPARSWAATSTCTSRASTSSRPSRASRSRGTRTSRPGTSRTACRRCAR